MKTQEMENPERLKYWLMYVSYFSYVKFKDNYDYRQFNAKLEYCVEKYMSEVRTMYNAEIQFFMQPLTGIHIDAGLDIDAPGNISLNSIYIFLGIALVVLVVVCINFINLSTAKALTRLREVGMRKTLGAARSRLVYQFLVESIMVCLLSIGIAIIIAEISLPFFNSIAGINLTINLLNPWWFIPVLAGVAVLVGLIAGIYPALYMSAFQPAKIIKGSLNLGKSKARLRKMLVTIQLAISLMLIIGTITVYNQISFMQNKNLGYDKDQIIVLPELNDPSLPSVDIIKREMAKLPGVLSVAASDRIPGQQANISLYLPEGYDENQTFMLNAMDIDADYIPTLGFQLIAGRNYSNEIGTDSTEAIIINQAVARKFGWTEPLGKIINRPQIDSANETSWIPFTVIGVVNDFHFTSLHKQVEPMVLHYDNIYNDNISIKISTEDIQGTISSIESKWNEISNSNPFNNYFLSESFNQQYQDDQRFGRITLYFSILAILLGCLGLFGMSLYALERRTKEVGIRKVLGSSVSGIVRLIMKEFIILALFANLIAWPIAYLFLNSWLQNYAYHININLITFIISSFIALFITTITVGYHSIKAGLMNPVNTIKHE